MDMEYRRLGNSGLKVSKLCLGAMMFGEHTDAATAARIAKSAFASGVNFGLSNFQGWRIAEVVARCRQWGIPQPIVLQPCYHALYRIAEVEMFPACRQHGLGIVPYSPLAHGVLTGKYLPGARPPADSRAGRKETRFLETEFRAESLAIAQKFGKHAGKKGMSVPHFALNWVLNNALVTSVLAGPRTFAQWQDYLAALDHKLDAEDEALVDTLVPPGHCSTPGYTDPKYPVTGRVARC